MLPTIWTARFYRQSPADPDCQLVPVFEGEPGDLEANLGEALLGRFNTKRSGVKPPHTVDLVDEYGTVLIKLYAVDAHRFRRAVGL